MATRSKLADFEVLSRLGSGSFGTVYKVRRIVDENMYVIKNVRIIELSFKEQSEAINEVQILAQLKSPYVVRYYDSFIEKESLHIVMEFCNRGDLQNLIKKAKDKNVAGLKEDVIWSISSQIMLGLHYLHKKNILHRDLKSANVFLTKDESKSHYLVKIGDLGVAKLMDTSTALANTIVGTPYYLSPELCADMPYRDKSDCWALGVLIYECATLQHPFEARNQCALIMKIIEGQVKIPPGTVISTEMRNIILWLLQKDPNARPSIKHILNEQSVREKLRKDQFELPEELLDTRITDLLTNPKFEAKTTMKKKGSNLQMLAKRTQEEALEAKVATAAATATAVVGGIADPDAPKRPPVKPRENSRDQLRIGSEPTTPISPSNGVKGVRRTGPLAISSDAKHEMSTPQQQQNLTVAGVGQRTEPATTGRPASYRGGGPSAHSGGADAPPTIRGNRVRGPISQRRAPSEKALNRYQVQRNVPSSSTRSNDAQSKHDADSKDSGSSGTHRNGTDLATEEQADSKDVSEYEEDFEEYDGEDGWEEDEQEVPAPLLNSSKHPHQPVGPSGAEEKTQRGLESSMSRFGGKDDGSWDQDDNKSEMNFGPSRVQSLRNPHFMESSGDPFHQTDDSAAGLAHMNHNGTLSDNNTWDPVWTQTRGIIDTNGARGRTESGEVGTTDLGAGLYQEALEGVQEEEVDDADEDGARNSDLSPDDSGAEPAMFMIEEARTRAVGILGEDLFWKVYDLCTKQMSKANEEPAEDGKISASDQAFLKELDEVLYQEGRGTIQFACEAAFCVKTIVSLEFGYANYMDTEA